MKLDYIYKNESLLQLHIAENNYTHETIQTETKVKQLFKSGNQTGKSGKRVSRKNNMQGNIRTASKET